MFKNITCINLKHSLHVFNNTTYLYLMPLINFDGLSNAKVRLNGQNTFLFKN